MGHKVKWSMGECGAHQTQCDLHSQWRQYNDDSQRKSTEVNKSQLNKLVASELAEVNVGQREST